MKIVDQYGDMLETTTIDDDGNVTVEHTQDVEPILENNKAECNDNMHRGDYRKMASIPNVVALQWLAEGIDIFNENHLPAVIRKLNSPEYRYLRTTPGKI